ncbi:MAG: type IV pilus secretin PilQ [Deltaproteobacteria bacterium]|nr:type IV pilus secretin PilQ [Deltaproteobacteria bacterium]
MSVLSKALRFVVVVLLINGCVATKSGNIDPAQQTDAGSTATNMDVASGDSSKMPDAASVRDENISSTPNAKQTALDTTSVVLEKLSLNKTKENSGTVMISFTDAVPFELKQTTPTEYILLVAGTRIAEQAKVPLLGAPGVAGIRSVRAMQNGSSAQIRMFVDGGVNLKAALQGNSILVTTASDVAAMSTDARSQMADAAKKDQAPAKVTDDAARSNPTGINSADGTKNYTGRLISLDLQDTDIDNALRIIAEVSNLNIIASDEVAGKVTLRLVDVPWDQALDVILKTNGLDQVTEGNVVRIAPVDKLRQEREALIEARKAAQNLEELSVTYNRVSYAKATDLTEQVQSVLSERGSVAVDDRTNQLIIKDIKEGQEKAAKLLAKLDLRTPQVLLETQIVEGSRNILRDLGFRLGYVYKAGPETGNATGLNFPNSIDSVTRSNYGAGNVADTVGTAISAIFDSADGSKTLTAQLTAYEQEGKVKIISRPQVATINNKAASIRSVEVLRIRLPDAGTSIATGSGASASGGATAAFEEIEVGITLNVTPQASPDYYVLLDINAKSSTIGPTIVDNIPSTVEREATSTVLVESGTTFALGGVYRIEDRDTVTGVPFLKDLPFLGYLFRNNLVDDGDEELIFFITPHVVEGSFDAAAMQ